MYQVPPPPESQEEAQKRLNEAGGDILYGSGLGQAMLNVGGIIAFPPYGIYVLGDALLNLGGYDIKPSGALPEEEQQKWDALYSDVTSGPGRVAAAVAGTEFRSNEVIADRNRKEAEKREPQAPVLNSELSEEELRNY